MGMLAQPVFKPGTYIYACHRGCPFAFKIKSEYSNVLKKKYPSSFSQLRDKILPERLFVVTFADGCCSHNSKAPSHIPSDKPLARLIASDPSNAFLTPNQLRGALFTKVANIHFNGDRQKAMAAATQGLFAIQKPEQLAYLRREVQRINLGASRGQDTAAIALMAVADMFDYVYSDIPGLVLMLPPLDLRDQVRKVIASRRVIFDTSFKLCVGNTLSFTMMAGHVVFARALFINKPEKDTFKAIFQKVKDGFDGVVINEFIADGDLAAANAALEVWPDAKLYHCSVHIKACWVRKAQELTAGHNATAFDRAAMVEHLLLIHKFGRAPAFEAFCLTWQDFPFAKKFIEYLKTYYGPDATGFYPMHRWALAYRRSMPPPNPIALSLFHRSGFEVPKSEFVPQDHDTTNPVEGFHAQQKRPGGIISKSPAQLLQREASLYPLDLEAQLLNEADRGLGGALVGSKRKASSFAAELIAQPKPKKHATAPAVANVAKRGPGRPPKQRTQDDFENELNGYQKGKASLAAQLPRTSTRERPEPKYSPLDPVVLPTPEPVPAPDPHEDENALEELDDDKPNDPRFDPRWGGRKIKRKKQAHLGTDIRAVAIFGSTKTLATQAEADCLKKRIEKYENQVAGKLFFTTCCTKLRPDLSCDQAKEFAWFFDFFAKRFFWAAAWTTD